MTNCDFLKLKNDLLKWHFGCGYCIRVKHSNDTTTVKGLACDIELAKTKANSSCWFSLSCNMYMKNIWSFNILVI